MKDLVISKINEVYLHVECEKHIAQELNEFFEFFVPGYKFAPAFRNRIWDGKIRLFHLNSKKIYYGLLNNIEDFCKSREYTYEFTDNVDVEDEFSLYHAKKFSESLNLHSSGKKIEARDVQLDAFCHAMQRKRQGSFCRH